MVPGKVNNWAFDTVPQTGLNGRIGYQPRGKGLGGSSAINAMVYIRGHRTRLRSMGLARQSRLVVHRRAALFQALRGQRRFRRRVSRQGRAARASTNCAPTIRCSRSSCRRRSEGQFRDPRGLQCRRARRPRHLPGDAEERRALERGARLYPSAYGQPRQSARRDQRARHPHPVRRQARGRRRIPAGQGDEADPRAARGDRLLRRVPDPATADAVGRRRRRRTRQARHRQRASSARRRTEPAGPSGFRVRLHVGQSELQRPLAEGHSAAAARDQPVPPRTPRTDDLEFRRVRRLPEDPPRPRRARHPAAFRHGDGRRPRPQAPQRHRLLHATSACCGRRAAAASRSAAPIRSPLR